MKPPPRQRTKPTRDLSPPEVRPVLLGDWTRTERSQLLAALSKLHKTGGGRCEIDCVFLRNAVPTRTLFELRSAVESLKDKVITSAKFKVHMQRWQEKKDRKPIELWAELACVAAGKLVEPISAAFSQMLIVSSTEPRTLRNCDPPQGRRPSAGKGRPVRHTVPLRPAPRLHVQGDSTDVKTTNATLPVPNAGPVLPAPSQVMRETSTVIPPFQQECCTAAGTLPTASVTSDSAAGVCHSSAASASLLPPVPQTTTPVSSGYSVDSAGQAPPLELSVCSVTTVKKTTQSSEPPNDVRSLPASTSLPEPILHATGETSSSSEPRLDQSPVISGSAQPNQATEVTACFQPLNSTVPVNPADDAPSEPHHSTLTASVPNSNPPPSIPDTPMSSSITSGDTSAVASSSVPTVSHDSPKCSPPPLSTNGCPKTSGVEYVVDFEKIYRYLSVIHKQSEECVLTPMESAIVLDLIMSLPEELPLLDCKKLHQHLIQVYKCFTAPAGRNRARAMLKEFHPNKAGRHECGAATPREGFLQSQAPRGGISRSDPKRRKRSTATNSQRNTAKPKGASLDSAGPNPQSANGQAESQSGGSNNVSMQSEDLDVMWHCPPLNPFMVPVKLLMRR